MCYKVQFPIHKNYTYYIKNMAAKGEAPKTAKVFNNYISTILCLIFPFILTSRDLQNSYCKSVTFAFSQINQRTEVPFVKCFETMKSWTIIMYARFIYSKSQYIFVSILDRKHHTDGRR